jgi:dienelactone hydrolase
MGSDYFSYTAAGGFAVRPVRRMRRFELSLVEYASPLATPFARTNRVVARYYRPEGAAGAVVVLHGINAEFSARHLAAYLARHGIASLQVTLNYGWRRRPRGRATGTGRAAEVFREGFRQAVMDTRRAVDFLESRHERVGICGVSLGAIVGAVAFSVDARFAAAALVLGCGELARAVFDSREVFVRLSSRALRRQVTRRELEQAWREIEPLSYARPGRKVLMVNAKYDTVVRPAHTRALWQAFGRPPIHWLNTAHMSAYTHIFFVRSLVRRFLKQAM